MTTETKPETTYRTVYLAITVTDDTSDAMIQAALASADLGLLIDKAHGVPAGETNVSAHLVTGEAIERLGDDIKRRAYFDTVRGIVADAERAILDGELEDREALSTWLHETIDGHHDVIYTYAAQDVLRYSENDGAYVENFGTDGVTDQSGGINWSALAFAHGWGRAQRGRVLPELPQGRHDRAVVRRR
jgi:hypothetical protein